MEWKPHPSKMKWVSASHLYCGSQLWRKYEGNVEKEEKRETNLAIQESKALKGRRATGSVSLLLMHGDCA